MPPPPPSTGGFSGGYTYAPPSPPPPPPSPHPSPGGLPPAPQSFLVESGRCCVPGVRAERVVAATPAQQASGAPYHDDGSLEYAAQRAGLTPMGGKPAARRLGACRERCALNAGRPGQDAANCFGFQWDAVDGSCVLYYGFGAGADELAAQMRVCRAQDADSPLWPPMHTATRFRPARNAPAGYSELSPLGLAEQKNWNNYACGVATSQKLLDSNLYVAYETDHADKEPRVLRDWDYSEFQGRLLWPYARNTLIQRPGPRACAQLEGPDWDPLELRVPRGSDALRSCAAACVVHLFESDYVAAELRPEAEAGPELEEASKRLVSCRCATGDLLRSGFPSSQPQAFDRALSHFVQARSRVDVTATFMRPGTPCSALAYLRRKPESIDGARRSGRPRPRASGKPGHAAAMGSPHGACVDGDPRTVCASYIGVTKAVAEQRGGCGTGAGADLEPCTAAQRAAAEDSPSLVVQIDRPTDLVGVRVWFAPEEPQPPLLWYDLDGAAAARPYNLSLYGNDLFGEPLLECEPHSQPPRAQRSIDHLCGHPQARYVVLRLPGARRQIFLGDLQPLLACASPPSQPPAAPSPPPPAPPPRGTWVLPVGAARRLQAADEAPTQDDSESYTYSYAYEAAAASPPPAPLAPKWKTEFLANAPFCHASCLALEEARAESADPERAQRALCGEFFTQSCSQGFDTSVFLQRQRAFLPRPPPAPPPRSPSSAPPRGTFRSQTPLDAPPSPPPGGTEGLLPARRVGARLANELLPRYCGDGDWISSLHLKAVPREAFCDELTQALFLPRAELGGATLSATDALLRGEQPSYEGSCPRSCRSVPFPASAPASMEWAPCAAWAQSLLRGACYDKWLQRFMGDAASARDSHDLTDSDVHELLIRPLQTSVCDAGAGEYAFLGTERGGCEYWAPNVFQKPGLANNFANEAVKEWQPLQYARAGSGLGVMGGAAATEFLQVRVPASQGKLETKQDSSNQGPQVCRDYCTSHAWCDAFEVAYNQNFMTPALRKAQEGGMHSGPVCFFFASGGASYRQKGNLNTYVTPDANRCYLNVARAWTTEDQVSNALERAVSAANGGGRTCQGALELIESYYPTAAEEQPLNLPQFKLSFRGQILKHVCRGLCAKTCGAFQNQPDLPQAYSCIWLLDRTCGSDFKTNVRALQLKCNKVFTGAEANPNVTETQVSFSTAPYPSPSSPPPLPWLAPPAPLAASAKCPAGWQRCKLTGQLGVDASAILIGFFTPCADPNADSSSCKAYNSASSFPSQDLKEWICYTYEPQCLKARADQNSNSRFVQYGFNRSCEDPGKSPCSLCQNKPMTPRSVTAPTATAIANLPICPGAYAFPSPPPPPQLWSPTPSQAPPPPNQPPSPPLEPPRPPLRPSDALCWEEPGSWCAEGGGHLVELEREWKGTRERRTPPFIQLSVDAPTSLEGEFEGCGSARYYEIERGTRYVALHPQAWALQDPNGRPADWERLVRAGPAQWSNPRCPCLSFCGAYSAGGDNQFDLLREDGSSEPVQVGGAWLLSLLSQTSKSYADACSCASLRLPSGAPIEEDRSNVRFVAGVPFGSTTGLTYKPSIWGNGPSDRKPPQAHCPSSETETHGGRARWAPLKLLSPTAGIPPMHQYQALQPPLGVTQMQLHCRAPQGPAPPPAPLAPGALQPPSRPLPSPPPPSPQQPVASAELFGVLQNPRSQDGTGGTGKWPTCAAGDARAGVELALNGRACAGPDSPLEQEARGAPCTTHFGMGYLGSEGNDAVSCCGQPATNKPRACVDPAQPVCRGYDASLKQMGHCAPFASAHKCAADADCGASERCADALPPWFPGRCAPREAPAGEHLGALSWDKTPMFGGCIERCCEEPRCRFLEVNLQTRSCRMFSECREPGSRALGLRGRPEQAVLVFSQMEPPPAAPPSSPAPPAPPPEFGRSWDATVPLPPYRGGVAELRASVHDSDISDAMSEAKLVFEPAPESAAPASNALYYGLCSAMSGSWTSLTLDPNALDQYAANLDAMHPGMTPPSTPPKFERLVRVYGCAMLCAKHGIKEGWSPGSTGEWFAQYDYRMELRSPNKNVPLEWGTEAEPPTDYVFRDAPETCTCFERCNTRLQGVVDARGEPLVPLEPGEAALQSRPFTAVQLLRVKVDRGTLPPGSSPPPPPPPMAPSYSEVPGSSHSWAAALARCDQFGDGSGARFSTATQIAWASEVARRAAAADGAPTPSHFWTALQRPDDAYYWYGWDRATLQPTRLLQLSSPLRLVLDSQPSFPVGGCGAVDVALGKIVHKPCTTELPVMCIGSARTALGLLEGPAGLQRVFFAPTGAGTAFVIPGPPSSAAEEDEDAIARNSDAPAVHVDFLGPAQPGLAYEASLETPGRRAEEVEPPSERIERLVRRLHARLPRAPRAPRAPKGNAPEPLDPEKAMESVGAHLDSVCCVRPTRLMHVPNASSHDHCHRKHCANHAVREAVAAVGRRLQTRERVEHAADAPQVSQTPSVRRAEGMKLPEGSRGRRAAIATLSPAQHAFIDVLNDHAHEIEECRGVFSGLRPPGATRSVSECAMHTVARRVAEHHGVEAGQVRAAIDRMGTGFAASFAGMASAFRGAQGLSRARRSRLEGMEERLGERPSGPARRARDLEGAFGRALGEVPGLPPEAKEAALSAMERARAAAEAATALGRAATKELEAGRTPQGGHGLRAALGARFGARASHGSGAGFASDLRGAFGSWTARAAEQARGMRDLSRRSQASQIQRKAREGRLQDPDPERPSTFEAAELVAVAVGADGSAEHSVTATLRDAGYALRDAAEGAGSSDALAEALRPRPEPPAPTPAPRAPRRRLSEAHPGRAAGLEEQQRRLARVLQLLHNESLMLGDEGTLRAERWMSARARDGSWAQRLAEELPWGQLLPALRSWAAADARAMRWWAGGGGVGRRLEEEPPPEVAARAPPTELGRALRRLGFALLHGALPDWEGEALDEALGWHRAPEHELPARGRELAERAFLDGRARSGPTRRLMEDFGRGVFGSWLRAPQAGQATPPSPPPAPEGEPGALPSEGAAAMKRQYSDFIEALASYFAYNVVLCYMYKPEADDGTPPQTLSDGSRVDSHRTSHACFPAIPIALPTVPHFTELFGIADPADYYWRDPDYFVDWCSEPQLTRASRGAGTWVARLLGLNPEDGYGRSVRRLFEYPVASLSVFEDLARAFQTEDGVKRLRLLMCALSRLTSVFFVFAALFVFLGVYLVCCWPLFQFSNLLCFFCFCCGLCKPGGRRKRVRFRALKRSNANRV